ncbi:MAG: plasmid mobilization relaxosome protein MobC [Rhizobiaceae bacterium]
MSELNDDRLPSLKAAFSAAAPVRGRPQRKTSPVTLRLTEAERQQLEDMAAGMTLSTYIRACLFAKEERRRKRRPKSTVADKKAIAEALALLGQSRIANNLNQLAYQANIGALAIEDRERAKIEEAYGYVLSMRALLVSALGSDE